MLLTLLNSRAPLRNRGAGLLLGLVAIAAGDAAAFDMDSNAPVSITADRARLDDTAGKATYTGDVVVTQAETVLYADRVVLYRDETGLNRIEAFGEPARYEQAATPENPATDARAREIEFERADNLLIFRHEAVIHQDGDIFRGEVIRYDTETRVVTAESGGLGNGERVEMIIQPRRDGDSTGSGNPEAGTNGPSTGE